MYFSYTVSITVNKQVPYQTRYHVFCWSLTFRCSRYKTEMRNEIATEVRDGGGGGGDEGGDIG